MAEKFRSIDAFRKFEQRRLTDDAAPPAPVATAESVNPFRLLALLKKHPNGMAKSALREALGANAAELDTVCLKLMSEDLLRVEPGEQGGEDMLFPA